MSSNDNNSKSLNNADTRALLNKELVVLLTIDTEFKDDCQKIRKHIGIPPKYDYVFDEKEAHEPTEEELDFNFDNDVIYRSLSDSEGREILYTDSAYILSLDKRKQIEFKKSIFNLLVKNGLPLNFFYWAKAFVLYDKIPEIKPIYNWNIVDQIIMNPSESKRIGLTSQEKNYIKQEFRRFCGIKTGRPPKKFQRVLKELDKILSQNKNSNRRYRSLDKVLRILELKEKEFSYKKITTDENEVSEPYNYAAMAADIYGTNDMNHEKQEIQNLRKINERYEKRKLWLLKKKLKK